MITVTMHEPHDSAVQDARQRLLDMGLPTTLMAAALFGGDRWSCVEVVALATSVTSPDGAVVGMATLAPTDELGGNGPHVIGVWVERGARRRGIGTRLLTALVDESVRRYGVPPTVVATTTAGLHLARHVARLRSLPIVAAVVTSGIDLAW